ncbi:hypothetical protein KUTeg_021258 [Tegillarca granosa]|uniref:Uncharacterized protein n=1 Tax=Tegillarca granosa TaxID=220873 RepID=A0ABQ9EAA1_TEGGR|nr:hypothetical protein KUTeg_021258 [Tegillarca granosa]
MSESGWSNSSVFHNYLTQFFVKHTAELTAKPYLKAMSAENLVSAFRKTGIFPFNNKAITDVDIAPASIYKPAETDRGASQ